MRISDWSSDVCSSDLIRAHAQQQLQDGRRIFRFDTFGDEDFWGGQLQLHEALANVTPRQALAPGLKISSRALPPDQIGRASCRERVCPYVSISVGAVSLKKQR